MDDIHIIYRSYSEGRSLMEERELTCIGCPMGCLINVKMEGGEIQEISGYTCSRGKTYARKEVTDPTRIVTSTVPVLGSSEKTMVSVKTRTDVPKEKTFEIVRALRGIFVKAPVRIGDLVLSDAAESGVDVIATGSVPR